MNKTDKKSINSLFRKLNQHMLTLVGKNGTNPDQAKVIIERLDNEINSHFGTNDKYKIHLTFDVATGQMIMAPGNDETKEIFDLYWKYNS